MPTGGQLAGADAVGGVAASAWGTLGIVAVVVLAMIAAWWFWKKG